MRRRLREARPLTLADCMSGTRPFNHVRASRLVEQGLTWKDVEWLVAEMAVPLLELGWLTAIPRTTFSRRKKAGRFSSAESDRIMRFARLWAFAKHVFETEGAREWLKQPVYDLRRQVPLDVARSETGAREVEAVLRWIAIAVHF